MLWHYTRRDTKVLLLATLLLASGYGLMLAQSWRTLEVRTIPSVAQTVGVYASVPDNGYNSLAMQLAEKEAELDAREYALAATGGQPSADTRVLLAVTLLGAGLLGLILFNFYLDHTRRQSLT